MSSSMQTKKAVFPRRNKRDGVEIVVAAQPPLFCEVLSRRLNEEPTFSVVGRASDSDHMWKVLARENPQVLLFDYEGLGSNADSIVHRLRRAAPATRILALSNRSSGGTAVRALGAGASGLVGKQLKFSVLVNAIQAVAEGEIWAKTPGSVGGSKSDLTKREYEVADACRRGLRNKEIAKLLHISEKSVKGHLNNIFRKLQVDNRFARQVSRSSHQFLSTRSRQRAPRREGSASSRSRVPRRATGNFAVR